MIRRYIKKPIPVEAVYVSSETIEEVKAFCQKFKEGTSLADAHFCGTIQTLEGDMAVHYGNYILKGIDGEFWAVRGDIFVRTYEYENREIHIGKQYLHFKGGSYIPKEIVLNADNMEQMVVYEDEKTGTMWVRKKEEFLSPVDTEKYPNANQFYRFEECDE
ncbi:DUF1653 domain-containing protein [Faecalibaculum rodentium]|uniref:DUF1653 domain-containing protein n=1 Tax=Faecalibaculum rodentium TaxID=1702221 RepID=UPI002729FAA6|nr:DUF1653 domain-containing protein [Faecalibaculum rodentium]